VGIIHIELHRVEEIRDLSCWCISSIDQVLALSSQENLTSHCDFRALLVPYRTGSLFFIVEDDSDTRFVDTGLALFVDKFREVSSSDLTQVCNTKNKADGIKDIGLSRSIETSDGIEMWVESVRKRDKFLCENQ